MTLGVDYWRMFRWEQGIKRMPSKNSAWQQPPTTIHNILIL